MRSVIIHAPIAEVWAAVRPFDGVVHWNPAVVGARMETGSPTAVGSIRHLDIADGSVFRETLLAHSDIDRLYAYDIVEGPLPVTDYVSVHRFVPVTDGDLTLGIWSGEFNCAPSDAEQMEQVVGDMIYRDGMRGLDAFMKGQTTDE